MLNVMTTDQIRRVAPSVFADAAHESRSARYAYIPSINIVDALRSEGFFPVSAQQSRGGVGKALHTKHMVKFRRDSTDNGTRALGDVIAELIMVNSHDGSSAYSFLAGLHRLICLNGMVASMGDLGTVKVNHSGNVIDKVIEGSYRIIDGASRAIEVAKEWRAIELKPDEQMIFARAAAQLRFDPESQRVNPSQLIAPRRAFDQSNDLWTVFNRAQEGLMRGGQRYVSDTGRRQRARPVVAIDKNVGLNQALWTLGAEMAKLKGGNIPTLTNVIN